MGFSFAGFAIACVVGAIVGAVIAFGVIGMENETASLIAFFASYAVIAVIGTIIYAVIGTKIIRNKLFRAGKTMINGVSIVRVTQGSRGEYSALFIEDDMLDNKGQPYMIAMGGGSAWQPVEGSRMVLIINDGSYFLMDNHESFKGMIKDEEPMKYREDLLILASPGELLLNEKPVKRKTSDLQDKFFRKYKNTNRTNRALAILGTAFFGFCGWTILILGLYGLFFQKIGVSGNYFLVGIPLIPVLTGLSIAVCVNLFKFKLHKKYGRIKNAEEVIFLGYVPSFNYLADFIISEKDEYGHLQRGVYSGIDGFDCADVKKMKRGHKIVKYTFEDGKIFFGSK